MTHWINPWSGAVPVAIEELANCHEGLGQYYSTMVPGERVLMTQERILEHWRSAGDKLDAYILPQPNGWHCIGIRYGNEGSEYLSPPGNLIRTRALLERTLQRIKP